MENRRAESAREGVDKPFNGAASDAEHDHMRRKAAAYLVPPPLLNQMLDSLEGYINNIAASGTQALSNGGPIDELYAVLAVLVDTVSVKEKEIKSLYKHINVLKKKGALNSSSETNAGGGMTGNVCPYFAAVGRSAPHKKGSCYFDPNKITVRREGARKLMDEKGVACKDENWRRGGAEIVVHRNSIKENLSYEAILSCIPPPSSIPTLPTNTTTKAQRYLPQSDTGVVDYVVNRYWP